MVLIRSSLATLGLLAATASSHYTLNYPPAQGFKEDQEDKGPCGGNTLDFNSKDLTNFHVDGDAVAMNLLHPEGRWLFRATLETSDSPSNWTQVFPHVLQSGLGKFCEPSITVPSSWAGKKGIVSVVCDAQDGLLYQCAAVNFVAGSNKDVKQCTNTSGVDFSFTSDPKLTPLASSSGGSSGGNSSGNSTTGGDKGTQTGSSPASTTSKKDNGASSLTAASVLGNAVAAAGVALLAASYAL